MTKRKVIAVCGKGGVGKTAITTMLVNILSKKYPGRLLVVDADPALGLNYALGRTTEKTIGSVRDKVIKTATGGNKQEMEALADEIDYLVAQALDEGEDYSFLAMGRMEKAGCFCSVNDLLKRALEELADQFEVVLIDGEAGLEQLNRQVIEDIDTLVIVTDTSLRGIKTVGHIQSLVKEGLVPSCKKMGVVFNKAIPDEEKLQEVVSKLGLEVFGQIPYDKSIQEFDTIGKPLTELSANDEAYKIVEGICQKL